MSKLGRFKSQGFVQNKLTRRIGQVFFRPNNMGNFHKGVIKDYTVVINRHAIGFNNNEIPDFIGIKRHLATHNIIYFVSLVFRRSNAYDIRSAFSQILFYLFFRKMTARAAVNRRFSLGHLCIFFGFQLFGCTETVVSLAFSQQFFCILTI